MAAKQRKRFFAVCLRVDADDDDADADADDDDVSRLVSCTMFK